MIVVKLFPDEPGKEKQIQEKLNDAVKGIGEVKDIRIEPLAFGLNVVRAGILIPDKQEGAMQELEKKLNEIEEVKEVQVEGVTLI